MLLVKHRVNFQTLCNSSLGYNLDSLHNLKLGCNWDILLQLPYVWQTDTLKPTGLSTNAAPLKSWSKGMVYNGTFHEHGRILGYMHPISGHLHTHSSHDASVCMPWFAIYHQYSPVMLAYMPYIRILWDMPTKLCQRGGQVPWARRQLAGLLQRGKVWGRSGTIDNSGHLGILIPNHNGCWWILWMNGSVHMVYLLLYCGYLSIPTNIHGVLNH